MQCFTLAIGRRHLYKRVHAWLQFHNIHTTHEHLNPTGCISGLKTNLHVPATAWFSRGAQISTSEKVRFVVLSPSHEKLTNTQPLLGGDAAGVAVGNIGAICAGDGDGDGDGVDAIDTAILDGTGKAVKFSCDKTQ